jgi:hypothetical protein
MTGPFRRNLCAESRFVGSGGAYHAAVQDHRRAGAWNLLLLVPFLLLVTPWFNTVEPRLFGMPFFYWAQFAWVPVTVACLAVVHIRIR